jgi:prophage regulatory protein
MDDQNITEPNRLARRAAGTRRNQAAPAIDAVERIVREAECEQRTGLSRSTRWRLERSGDFPQRRRLSAGCCGWLASEISSWIASR